MVHVASMERMEGLFSFHGLYTYSVEVDGVYCGFGGKVDLQKDGK